MVVTKPVTDAGKIVQLDGEPFKYPSQSFYVQPALSFDKKKLLITDWRELDVDEKTALERQEYIFNNNAKVYDYQKSLAFGVCSICHCPLQWELGIKDADDKFCRASCCGMVYEMVPETVRVISRPEPKDTADEDFLEQLRNI